MGSEGATNTRFVFAKSCRQQERRQAAVGSAAAAAVAAGLDGLPPALHCDWQICLRGYGSWCKTLRRHAARSATSGRGPGRAWEGQFAITSWAAMTAARSATSTPGACCLSCRESDRVDYEGRLVEGKSQLRVQRCSDAGTTCKPCPDFQRAACWGCPICQGLGIWCKFFGTGLRI